MFTELCDGYTHSIRLFFVVFWIINVLILMNIMISIVLDLYGNLQPEIEAKFKEQQDIGAIYKWLEPIEKNKRKKLLTKRLKKVQELER